MNRLISSSICYLGILAATSTARALPLPDSSTCNTVNANGCLRIQNTSTSPGFATIQGLAGVNAWGLHGEAGIGVRAISNSTSGGSGVQASANHSSAFGVLATNGPGVGVQGQSVSSVGVKGVISPAAAIAIGVQGVNSHPFGYAVFASGNLGVSGTPFCAGCTTFTNNSDERLKTNIHGLSGALDTLLRLRGVTFEWKDPSKHNNLTGQQRGFIAQEVEKVLPEWVGVDEKGYKTLNTRGLEAMLVESLRDLKSENDELRSRLKRVEAAVNRPDPRASWLNPALGVAGTSLVGIALALGRRPRRDDSNR